MFFNRWFKLSVTFAVVVSAILISIVYSTPALADAPQTSDVYGPFGCNLAAGECNIVGASQLVRSPNGVSMNLQTTGLDAGAVYTVWWVVFNNPEACIDGCDGPDLAIPEVLGTVLRATGHVVGNDGVGNFAAHLAESDTSGDSFPADLPGDTVGLVDAMRAEIHLVVRTHGAPIPGLVDEQISTFNGGCEINICANQQFAIHR